MNAADVMCKATVDGLGKKGEVFTFLICLDRAPDLKPGASITVEGLPVTITNLEDSYISFELSLQQLIDTALAEVEVGSEVSVSLQMINGIE